jgi:two-component system alkaline phosphatase synthesis response regulator PhoP
MTKILLVDDAAEINLMISKYLENNGFDVTSAYDGKQAIEILDSETEFDLMILDIIMPQQDGLDVLKHMMVSNNNIPVIGISGGTPSLPSDLALKAIQIYTEYILEKPFTPEKLLEKINLIIK